jgi:hypothetical protein
MTFTWPRKAPLLLVAAAIANLVGGGCSFFGNNASDDVTRLAPGECFNQPSGATDTRNVQRQPCGAAHDAEAISSASHPAAPGAPYPTTEELRTFMSSACVSAYASYTGSSYDPRGDFDFGLFYPLEDAWNAGDRDVVCYAFRIDGTKMTGSLKAPAGSTAPAS